MELTPEEIQSKIQYIIDTFYITVTRRDRVKTTFNDKGFHNLENLQLIVDLYNHFTTGKKMSVFKCTGCNRNKYVKMIEFIKSKLNK